jgi:C4-dicarboxylate transporter
MKFKGDIPCLVHVLNLVVQEILKTIIKEAYNDLDNKNIFNIKNEKEVEEEEITNSKSLFYLIILFTNIIISFSSGKEFVKLLSELNILKRI